MAALYRLTIKEKTASLIYEIAGKALSRREVVNFTVEATDRYLAGMMTSGEIEKCNRIPNRQCHKPMKFSGGSIPDDQETLDSIRDDTDDL